MEQSLHPNTERVRQALVDVGIEPRIRICEEQARTVAEAAATLGVAPGQIAKSLVFLADGEPVMVVASGDERVDTSLLSEALGGRDISRADADAVRAATGFPIGGVSPAGLPVGLPVLVQESLRRWELVWAAAGTWHAVFSTSFDDLLRITGGTPSAVGDVA